MDKDKLLYWAVTLVMWPLLALALVTDPRLHSEVRGIRNIDVLGVNLVVCMFIGWALALCVAVALILTFDGFILKMLIAVLLLHLVLGAIFRYVTWRPAFIKMMGYQAK